MIGLSQEFLHLIGWYCVDCLLNLGSTFYLNSDCMMPEEPTEQKKDQTPETQTRICKTCGLEKTVDHFISLYTDMVTHNCDYCRYRQRQQYKGMTHSISMSW